MSIYFIPELNILFESESNYGDGWWHFNYKEMYRALYIGEL